MITRDFFGRFDGKDVEIFTIKNSGGAYVELISYGCAVRSICVPDRDGKLVDVCLGYDTLEEYTSQDACLGAVIGRHANRIGGAKFVLNGIEYPLAVNNGPNNLHGGNKGFDKYIWDAEIVGESVVFSRISKDMEEGFPGEMKVTATYSFTDENELVLSYSAVCDKDTVCAMTNHSYFNLGGHDSGVVYDTLLKINADEFTENDENCLPTGKIFKVEGTPFDFREEKAIGKDIDLDDINLKNGKGYDHNFVLRGEGMKVAAVAFSEKTGIEMVTKTTQPGVQLYTANFLSERKAKGGKLYNERHGFCLETQTFPNGMAIPHFPKPILRKGEEYKETVCYKFNVR